MADVVIGSPIINSAFAEPARHFRFGEDGITDEVVEARRPSSHSVDDIACWMIDTNYDGESFFVRHVYFLGEGDPYASLKRALRAEIDEDAWASLYRSRSRPFDPPTTGGSP